MHALRHFYASVLIDAGESVKAVAEYLGHADPGVHAPRLRPPLPELRRSGPEGRRSSHEPKL
jgi:integrase